MFHVTFSNKQKYLIVCSILLVYNIPFCQNNPNIINNPKLHRTLFEELRSLRKKLMNTTHGNILQNQIQKLETLYLTNPEDLYNELKQIHEDYINFKQSDDYKKGIHDLKVSISEFSQEYESADDKQREKIHKYINSLDPYTKASIDHVLEHRYLYNAQNYNLTHLIESLPHMLTDFEGHHKAPKIHPSFKVNKKFRMLLDEIEHYYRPSSTKNMTYHEMQNYMRNLKKNFHPEHKEKFSSFLQEYFVESILENDYVKDRYTQNNMDKIIQMLKDHPENLNSIIDQYDADRSAKQSKSTTKQKHKLKSISKSEQNSENTLRFKEGEEFQHKYKLKGKSRYRTRKNDTKKNDSKKNSSKNKTKRNKTKEMINKLKNNTYNATEEKRKQNFTNKEMKKQKKEIIEKMKEFFEKLEETGKQKFEAEKPIIIKGTCEEREKLLKSNYFI